MQTLTIETVRIGQYVLCIDDTLGANNKGGKCPYLTKGRAYRVTDKCWEFVYVNHEKEPCYSKRFVSLIEDTQDMIEEDGKIG